MSAEQEKLGDELIGCRIMSTGRKVNYLFFIMTVIY